MSSAARPSVAAAPGVPQSSSLVHAKKEPFRITLATFLSDGLTINSLACTIAKSYDLSTGTSPAAFLVTA